MSESLTIARGDKREQYETLLPQISALIQDEPDLIARMANTAAMIHQTFGPLRTGFYRVTGAELVLGPFQGPPACTRIKHGRGVCGRAWAEQRTIIVPDVELFPGHIACSSASRSEIVVPLIKNGRVTAVLDIDSPEVNTFDNTDRHYLEQIARIITNPQQANHNI